MLKSFKSFKKAKTGQALVETMVVLALYFFMISFLISSFQAMYNKMVLTVAAYEYARTTVAYESSAAYAKNGQADGTTIRAYGDAAGKAKAKEVIDSTILAPSMMDIPTNGYKIYGMSSREDVNSTTAFNQRIHLYAKAVIKGKMTYLFPVVKPDLTGVISPNIDFEVFFIMSKERMWNA